MYKSLKILTIVSLLAMPLSSSALTKFIQTSNVGGDTRIGLYLADGEDVVSTANGVPQVHMRLDTLNELVTIPKGNIKVEVYRSTDDVNELVAVFNYPVKRGQETLDIRMNLPEFQNQSENFDFVVYDTAGNPRSKFRHSFASRELITLEPKPPVVEMVDEQTLAPEALEYIAKKFSVSMVPVGQPTGMQKKDGVYSFQVPARRLQGTLKQKNKIYNTSLDFDEVGTLANRDEFDNAAKGTVYLDKDSGLVYVKASDTAADWSDPIEFASYQESNGNTTSPGTGTSTGGTTVINNTTTVVQQLSPSQITNGSISVEKIEPVIVDRILTLPLKDSLRSTGTAFGTVANLSMPVIRYTGTGSSTWSLVLPPDLVRSDINHPNIKVILSWSSSNNTAQMIDWRLGYSSYDSGDLVNGNSVTNLDLSSSAPAVALTLTQTEFSIPVSALKDSLILKLSRMDSRDLKPNLSSIAIEYPGRVLE